MSSTSGTGKKRKAEDIIVDPETLKVIEDAKKPKIELNSEKKYRCIASIMDMYNLIMGTIMNEYNKALAAADVDMEGKTHPQDRTPLITKNVTVGNHIISIIFTVHNYCRQELKDKEANIIKKTKESSFKVIALGKEYLFTTQETKEKWLEITKKNGLNYQIFREKDEADWYGTMGPYLDMFASYALRVNELRLGHNNMPMTKVDGVHKSFPVSKYGLSGAHHVLLEGATFPPERRSSIVQSLGPMTSWICMIRSDGVYRNKYAKSVKRAMAHVPCIDDLIEITKNNKQPSEVSAITTILAEILLVTTARQATRMFFPITAFAHVWDLQKDKEKFCQVFNSTGHGGWYLYSEASKRGPFYMTGKLEEEKAAQIAFHSIFGTYREDLSILSQITDVGKWFTREELGDCFRQQGSSEMVTKIKLPRVKYYAKMSCANQTGLLSGVYNQVATVPCFSGKRVHKFGAEFFEHIEKKRMIGASGKTLNQIATILTSTLEELHDLIRKNKGDLEMGTTNWYDMGTITIDGHGQELDLVLKGAGLMFLGKK